MFSKIISSPRVTSRPPWKTCAIFSRNSFHPAFFHNAILSVTKRNPTVAELNNPWIRSCSVHGSWHKRLPHAVKLFVGSVSPTTEPIATKTPPLNLQWTNQFVGSDKPFKSGQQWLLQQQNKSEDKSIQSISFVPSLGASIETLCNDSGVNHVAK